MEEPGPLGKMEGGGSGVGLVTGLRDVFGNQLMGIRFGSICTSPPPASAPATPRRRRRITV